MNKLKAEQKLCFFIVLYVDFGSPSLKTTAVRGFCVAEKYDKTKKLRKDE